MPPSTETTAARVAGNVRAELGRRDWSRRRLAGAIGMDESTLARRLSDPDGSPFRVPELEAIAEVLDLTLAELIGERAGNNRPAP